MFLFLFRCFSFWIERTCCNFFSTREPIKDADENILGSINIFSLAKKYKVKKVIVASTAAVYGTPEYLPVDEAHSTTFLSFYGLSKFTMEQYLKLFEIDYIIFRFANVYGERQNSKGEAGVVAIFTDKMCNGEEITITGDGEQTRDFIYVKDVVKANIKSCECEYNGIVNVASGKKITINKLYNIIKKTLGTDIEAKYLPERQGDIKHSLADVSEMKKINYEVDSENFENQLKELFDEE